MRDGLLRVSGLSKSNRHLVDCLKDPELHGSAAAAMLKVLHDECRLPEQLLPRNWPHDLFALDFVAASTANMPPSKFADDVRRRLLVKNWEARAPRDVLHQAVTEALVAHMVDKRDDLCARSKGRLASMKGMLQQYDGASAEVMRRMPDLLAQIEQQGRVAVRRSPKRLDVDAPIPGAAQYVN